MRSIREQLTRRLLLTFSALLAVGGLILYISIHAALVKEYDAGLLARALAITTLTEQNDRGVKVEFSDHFMYEFRDRVATAFFQMWLPDGREVKRSESLHGSELPRRFGALAQPQFYDLRLPDGRQGRAVGVQFTPKMDRDARGRIPPQQVVLVVAAERRHLDHALAVLGLMLCGNGVLLLAAMMLVLPWVLRRALTPLHELAMQAAEIDAHKLDARFPSETLPTELAPIGKRLNDLLARLEQSFERERQFSANVAHELRTPIAELRALAELGLKWPDTRSTATDQETLAIALQMEAMVTTLFALLRSEDVQFAPQAQAFDLAPLLDSILSACRARTANKDITVAIHVPAAMRLHSDPQVLRSILTNLLDNAIEYSPVRARIEISAAPRESRFELRICNPAQGLTAADLPRLFDRFWRKDEARPGSDHMGLGLPLARAFAASLGLDLRAELEDEARVAFVLSGSLGKAAAVRNLAPAG